MVNGEVDYWANGWFPLHQALLSSDFGEKATLAGTVIKRGGIQGYMVDKASAEKFDLNSLDDFKRPEVQAAFDADDDGKADLVACQPAWACAKVTAHHLQVYDLKDHFNILETNYLMNMAGVLLRYQAGQSVLFYNWTPNWTHHHLIPGRDVVWLNVPTTLPTAEQQGLEAAMVQRELRGAVTASIRLGFVANDIRVVANKAFLDRNRAAKRLFAVMSIPLADIAAQSYRIFTGEYHQEDIERHASEWINQHQDLWGKWLEEARAAVR